MVSSSGMTANSFVQSASEFTFLQAKIDAQETERKRLEQELSKTRLDVIRRGPSVLDAGKHILEETGTLGNEWPRGPHFGTPQGEVALPAGSTEVRRYPPHFFQSPVMTGSVFSLFGPQCCCLSGTGAEPAHCSRAAERGAAIKDGIE